jgi:hypothetical protein
MSERLRRRDEDETDGDSSMSCGSRDRLFGFEDPTVRAQIVQLVEEGLALCHHADEASVEAA